MSDDNTQYVKPWGHGHGPTFNKTNVPNMIMNLPREEESELVRLMIDCPALASIEDISAN